MEKSAILTIKENETDLLLPSHFCWTKMGDEAGQSLNGIIARKDAERALGNGLFYWGIGSSLGSRIWTFVSSVKTPTILFSPMKSKAKKDDVQPEKVFAWTAYIDNGGNKHSLPKHALVTSRGTVGKKIKQFHYALVCHNQTSLKEGTWPKINGLKLHNYQRGSRLGFSQVTSLVEVKDKLHADAGYQVLFGAKLVAPYFVTLVDPVEIPVKFWAKVNAEWANNGYTATSWQKWIDAQMPKFKRVHSEKVAAVILKQKSHGKLNYPQDEKTPSNLHYRSSSSG